MQKKIINALVALTILAFIGIAVAGSVPDRTSVLTLSSTGLYSWTNTTDYANLELKRIDCLAMNYASDTVTVKRVTGDTRKQTNIVVGIICSSNYGASNLIVAADSGPVLLKYGDILTFTSGMGSNGYVQVEYINNRH